MELGNNGWVKRIVGAGQAGDAKAKPRCRANGQTGKAGSDGGRGKDMTASLECRANRTGKLTVPTSAFTLLACRGGRLEGEA